MKIDWTTRREMRDTATDYIKLLSNCQRHMMKTVGRAMSEVDEVTMAIRNISAWLVNCPAGEPPITDVEYWQWEALVNSASLAYEAYVFGGIRHQEDELISNFNAACDQLAAARTSGDTIFENAARWFLTAKTQLYAAIARKKVRS